MMKEVKLSIGQITKMKHAIGLNYSRPNSKGKYNAYRNYYDAGDEPNQEWEDLVSLNLATKRNSTISQSIIYHVSKEGLLYLSELLGISIIYED